MPLGSHLRELRNRVVIAAIAVVVGAVAGWFIYEPAIFALSAPLREAAVAQNRLGDVELNFGSVTSPFDLRVKVSAFIGVLVSSPIWLWQLWAFITPGLTRKEKRYAAGFVVVAVPLFLGGAAMAFFALPRAVAFLVELTPDGTVNYVDAPFYLGFVMRILLAFGIAFLLPVVLVALNMVGLLSGRTMLGAWRWVIVVCFTFAAIATPSPEATAMFSLALPMCALFFLAIGISLLLDRRRAKREGFADLADDEVSPL